MRCLRTYSCLLVMLMLGGACKEQPSASNTPSTQPDENGAPAESTDPGANSKASSSAPGDKPLDIAVEASSSLAQDERRYAPEHVVDDDLSTAWVEGVPGSGKGEWLAMTFERPARLEGLVIFPGHLQNAQTLVEYAAALRLAVEADGEKLGTFRLLFDEECDEYPPESPRGPSGCHHTGSERNREAARLIFFEKPREASRLKLTVEAASKGTKFEHMAISEIEPLVVGHTSRWLPTGVRQVFRHMRDRRPVEPLMADSATVEDLRNKYLKYHFLTGPTQQETIVYRDEPPEMHSISELSEANATGRDIGRWPYFARIAPDKRRTGELPTVKFVHYTAPVFLANASAVYALEGQTVIAGPMAVAWGNEMGGEIYPVIALDAEGRVTEMAEAVEYGRREQRPYPVIADLP